MKVKIKNYQAIKKAELEFNEGITAVVGSSNNGKSSIIRAIEAAINNKGGSDFINYDSESCEVHIEDQDNKVIWSKNRNSNKSYYELNKEKLNKIGQKQIEDVGKLLNMPEVVVNGDKFRLNFWKQLEFPFLVGKSHYQLFEFISKSKDQEVMANLLNETADNQKDTKREISELDVRIDTRTKDITSLESEIDELSKFSDFDIETFEKIVILIEQIKDALDLYEALPERISEQEDLISNIESEITSKSNILKNAKDTVEELSKSEEELKEIKERLFSIENIDRQIERAKISLSDISQTIEKEKESLGSFEVCPFCQQTLNSQGGHHE